MPTTPDDVRAALLLTNRLVRLGAAPMTAREFWDLVGRVAPGELPSLDAAGIASAAGVDDAAAQRIRTLLDAATAMSFEQERLADAGIRLVSALDPAFPARLRSRLGSACPPFLLLAGPIGFLEQPGLGVVGSRDAPHDLLAVAREAAAAAAGNGWAVVSGLARGVDQEAMNAAGRAGGAVVGVPAEGIVRAARVGEVRRRVLAGELCLASPYAPEAPFGAGAAMGRNKIVYALSQVTFAVAAAKGSGGTWGGAVEALDRRFGAVAVWAGPGATDGNRALTDLGATPVTDVEELFSIDPDAAPSPNSPASGTPSQDSLF